MKRRSVYFHRWVRKNPLFLWWLIFLPLMLLILLSSWEQLTVPVEAEPEPTGFLGQLFQTMTLVVLARVVLVAVGVVLIMICLFFPLFRVGKEGVQWSREQEEEIARVTGEITGAEVEALIQQEALRWSLVHRWLRFCGRKEGTPPVGLWELITTIGEAFPNERLSILWQQGAEVYTLRHPLLPKLVPPDRRETETLGVKLSFGPEEAFYFYLYAAEPVGFSTIDEEFILILCELFGRQAQGAGATPAELIASFELVDNPTTGSGIK
ncbi:MAG: hypothetical protein GX081_09445 [Firmicutes bacterium]|nr:hypothetical protein [Bacillota bacterium]